MEEIGLRILINIQIGGEEDEGKEVFIKERNRHGLIHVSAMSC